MFPAREGDLPKSELIKQAEEVKLHPEKHFKEFLELTGPNPTVEIYFKASCPYCGTRCMFGEPDQMFELMTCHNCHDTFEFSVGGFTLKLSSKE